jgi:ABC-type molybdenum transport system ATPase subunit/photorepair protein PhrA
MGLTALDAVGTGYEGVFSRRPLSDDQKKRVLYLLGQFKNELATSRTGHAEDLTIEDVARKQFAHYTPAQQTILVFLRAIVSRPPVLVLDEPTQGMDEKVWGKCRALLAKEWEEMKAEGKEQACIVVSHYDKEVPWRNGKVLELEDGEVTRSS